MSIDTTKLNSPGWWFRALTDRMASRNTRLQTLRDYITGNAPLPEGAAGMREAYQTFQRKARANFAELVVEAPVERMTPTGFRVNGELSDEARKIWSYNELDTFSSDIHADMLGLSEGYAIVGPPGSDGMPVITREDPLLVIASPDPLRPTRTRAALKLFRDDLGGTDYAYLYLPGVVYVAKRSNNGDRAMLQPGVDGFDWVDGKAPMRWPAGFEDVVPVVCWRNKNSIGEFERHVDTLDRINYVILQRLVIIAMQAYRQRAIKGDVPETKDKVDDEGNLIPDGSGGYEQEPLTQADVDVMFKPGPGALWQIPKGTELWESQTTDFSNVLAAAKDDIRVLAAGTRTPVYMLMPEGANQSAEGASALREQLVYKAADRIKRASYGWNQAMALALRFSGITANVTDMETLWMPPERLSLSERADAASKLVAAGVPWETIMTDVMQFSAPKVQEMEQQRINDIMNAVLGAGATTDGT